MLELILKFKKNTGYNKVFGSFSFGEGWDEALAQFAQPKNICIFKIVKTTYRHILSFVLCHLSFILFSQNIDSLKLVVKNAKHDTIKLQTLVQLSEVCDLPEIITYAQPAVSLADKLLHNKELSGQKNTILKILDNKAKALNNIGFMYHSNADLPKGLFYYMKGLTILEEALAKTRSENEIKILKKGISGALGNIGSIYKTQGEIAKGLEYEERALKLQKEIGFKEGIANSLFNLATTYSDQGDIPKALEYNEQSLKMREEMGDKMAIANSLNNIGVIYYDQEDLKSALQYHQKSLKIREEINDKSGIAFSLCNIAYVYQKQKNFSGALTLFTKSLKIHTDMENILGMANTQNNIGTLYNDNREFDKALEYFYESAKNLEQIGDKKALTVIYNNIARVFCMLAETEKNSSKKQKQYATAFSYVENSLNISNALGFPDMIAHSEETVARIDSARGNYQGAFEHYKRFIKYRDSINNEQTRKAGIRHQLKYEFEKKEAVIIEQQKKERAVAEEKNRFQKIIIFSVVAGLLLVVIFAAFIFRSLKVTKEQKIIIEEKQKEILDSINYAKRIQTSLMPTEKYLDKHLKQLGN